MLKEIIIILLILIIFNGLKKLFKNRKKGNYGDRDEKNHHMPETEKVNIERAFTGKKNVGAKAEVKSDLLQAVDQFSLRRSFWDHPIEAEIYSSLRQFITDDYAIIPHNTLSNIFYWKWDEDWKLTDRANKMHYDFAIYDNDFHLIFLMEVNGKEHDKPNRKEIDNFKASLLEKSGLRLITIDASKTIINLSKEVEERIKKEFPDRDSCPTYCPACHSHIPMALQLNKRVEPNIYYYRCLNKDCGVTHSLGKSGEFRKIAPLYKNMPDKL